MNISVEQARRFILVKQKLQGEPQLTGEDGILAFCRQAGCIQYDPVDACGRNADLTLQSRIRGYHKDMLKHLLYEKRELIDYWDKNMAILPITDWPFLTRTREGFRQAGLRSQDEISSREEAAKAYIRQNGPCYSDDLNMPEKVDWYWSHTTAARVVLEALYFRGELMIHHKRGTQKCYELTENLLNPTLRTAPDPYPDDREYEAERVRRRIGAVGMLWNKASDAFLGIDGLKAEKREQAFSMLLQKRTILPVDVAGIRSVFYILAEDEPILHSLSDDTPRTEFIAPLDPMMWDRKLILALFGFNYKWEIYTPAHQRKYGYYVLPVLQNGAFTARIEMERSHKDPALHVRHIWIEPGLKCDIRALKRRVKAFAVFAQADDILYDR
jgi:uncharacterized protein YcaQ